MEGEFGREGPKGAVFWGRWEWTVFTEKRMIYLGAGGNFMGEE